MDGALRANLSAIKKEVLRYDYDGFIVIDGPEGYGKSTLAAQIAYYLDPTYNLDRCCFTAEQWVQQVTKHKGGKAIVFDESYGYLSSRRALSKWNVALLKVMSEMRSRNLFIIIVLPSFFELDRYPAIHRSRALVSVYKRGFFMAFDKNRKKRLYVKGKRFYDYSSVPSNFKGRFTKYFPLNQKQYEQKKLDSVMPEVLDKLTRQEKTYLGYFLRLTRHLIRERDFTQKEIATILGVKHQYISEFLRKWKDSTVQGTNSNVYLGIPSKERLINQIGGEKDAHKAREDND